MLCTSYASKSKQLILYTVRSHWSGSYVVKMDHCGLSTHWQSCSMSRELQSGIWPPIRLMCLPVSTSHLASGGVNKMGEGNSLSLLWPSVLPFLLWLGHSFAVGDISACHAGTMWHSSASIETNSVTVLSPLSYASVFLSINVVSSQNWFETWILLRKLECTITKASCINTGIKWVGGP